MNFLFIQFPCCAPLRGKIIGMCLIKTFSMKSINLFPAVSELILYSKYFTIHLPCIHQKHIWLILSFSLTHFMLLIIIVTVANQYARPCQKKYCLRDMWSIAIDYELSNFVWIFSKLLGASKFWSWFRIIRYYSHSSWKEHWNGRSSIGRVKFLTIKNNRFKKKTRFNL